MATLGDFQEDRAGKDSRSLLRGGLVTCPGPHSQWHKAGVMGYTGWVALRTLGWLQGWALGGSWMLTLS